MRSSFSIAFQRPVISTLVIAGGNELKLCVIYSNCTNSIEWEVSQHIITPSNYNAVISVSIAHAKYDYFGEWKR
jgi:hypothetical protein